MSDVVSPPTSDETPRIGRACAWCGEPIKRFSRKDADTCSKRCRQARHRFRINPAAKPEGPAMRFAYADPPYPGLSKRYYQDHPQFGGEVDHAELIARLQRDYPDGWALSSSEQAVWDLIPMINAVVPKGVFKRLAIWNKGSRASASKRTRNAWEPVFVVGGRPRLMPPSETLDDVLVWGGRQHSHPGALVGMKPAAFCEWMFLQLGAGEGDELADVFPGSGAVGRAWKIFAGLGDADRATQLGLFGDEPTKVRSHLPSRLEEATTRTDSILDAFREARQDIAAAGVVWDSEAMRSDMIDGDE